MVIVYLRRLRDRLLFAGYLLVLLNSCAIGAPRSGIGALFTTPEAALADALGPGGWLDRDIERLMLHQHLRAPEGEIALYSGYAGDTLVLGSADAKPRAGKWYAHGMFRLPVPQLSGTQRMSCRLMGYPSSGTWVVAVTGRVDRPEVRHIVVVFDSAGEQRATMRDGSFMLIGTGLGMLLELHALDAAGAIVERIPARNCAAAH